MKHFLILLTAALYSVQGITQTTEDSVKAIVNKMFNAMKNSDAASLKTCFGDSVVFQTIAQDKSGNTIVINEDAGDFIESISKLPKGAADERIRIETIKIDGSLAMVWASYNFYYNGKLSHCGIDSFQLVRFADGWKIQYIIDTRRNQGCSPK